MIEISEVTAMQVEAIVKDNGLFIPNPGFPLGKQRQILVEIRPIVADAPSDPFVKAAGLLSTNVPDGVTYQNKLRSEWSE